MRKRQSLGQTIIEVAVALAILSIVGGALVSIGLSSVRTATNAKLQAEANDLAAEAIEVARHTRDKGTTTTLQPLLDIAADGHGCVDTDLELQRCLESTSQCFNKDMELVGCDLEHVFTRTIVVQDTSDPVGAANRVLITATVIWGQGGIDQTVTLSTYLTKWAGG